jgi:hypothetical protein
MAMPPLLDTSARRAALVAAALAAWPADARGADTDSSARPPALEGRTGCELWVGTVSGNDPSVLVEALICEGMNGAVTGQLQWSSLKSGYSIRDIAGDWKGRDALRLHDTKMAVSKPNPGWVFCLVDSYELTRNGDKLTGFYTSKKCSDRATVALTKKAVPAAPLPPEPSPSEPSPSEPMPSDLDPRADAEPAKPTTPPSACACRSVGAEANDARGAALLAGAALVSCARRKRARSRAAMSRASS